MQESHRFYDSIKNSLKAPYLVLDLRNNEGGAGKEMRKYFVLLQKFVRKGHLYVLINNGTLSQAEILTLPITFEHTAVLVNLALHHRDPFDRIIIAQALSEQLTVIGKDENFSKYNGLKLLW